MQQESNHQFCVPSCKSPERNTHRPYLCLRYYRVCQYQMCEILRLTSWLRKQKVTSIVQNPGIDALTKHLPTQLLNVKHRGYVLLFLFWLEINTKSHTMFSEAWEYTITPACKMHMQMVKRPANTPKNTFFF